MRPRRPLLFATALLVFACEPWSDAREVAAHYPRPVRLPEVLPSLQSPGPIPLGRVPADADDRQREALWWVNTYRAHAGLAPLDLDESLDASATGHASFMLDNPGLYTYQGGLSPHEQAEGFPGFQARYHWQRMGQAGYTGDPFSEVIDYRGVPSAAVTRWMETVYHRIPLLHPDAVHMGYAGAGSGRLDVLDLGAGNGEHWHIPNGAVWPPDGAVGVFPSWDGYESPAPPAPPNGFPSGPVLSLTFGDGEPPEAALHLLVDLQTGQTVPHVLLEPSNDALMAAYGVVSLYAHDPLAAGHTYELTLGGTANGAEFAHTSRFTVRTESGCSVAAQDCGIGRACHPDGGAGTCVWEGPGFEGQACGHVADCRAGAGCADGICVSY